MINLLLDTLDRRLIALLQADARKIGRAHV